jgi:hypothetical protein
MTPPERKGYLWNFYGYTKLHLWGCHLTGGFLGFFGSMLLMFSVAAWGVLPDRIFVRLLLLSIACFTGATAVAAGSVFSLVFFRGCAQPQSSSESTSAATSTSSDLND